VQIYKFLLTWIILSLFLLEPIVFSQTSFNVDLVSRWAHGPCNAADAEGNYAYIGNGAALQILDISDPTSPQLVGEINVPSMIAYINISGSFAYVVDYDEGRYVHNGLHVINIENPSAPFILGFYPIQDEIRTFRVQDNYAYISHWSAGLKIIDISDPSNMNEVGVYDASTVWYLDFKDNNAYLVGDSYLRILDLSDPSEPTEKGNLYLGGGGNYIVLQGDFAYIASSWRMNIINISVPEAPQLITYYDFQPVTGKPMALAASGDYVYAALNNRSVRVLDVLDPAQPEEVGSYDLTGTPKCIDVNNNRIFVVDDDIGLHILKVINLTKSWFYDVSVESAVTIDGNYAFLAEGGSSDSLRIFNITNPSNPIETGSCPFSMYASDGMHAVTIYNQHAYVAYGQEGVHFIDISNPSSPMEVGMFRDWSECRDVAIDGNYAYIAGNDHNIFNNGLLVVDISNLSNPILETSLPTGTGFGVEVRDGYAFVTSDSGLFIIDVSDPPNAFVVGSNYNPSNAYDLVLKDNYAYVINYAGLYIFDISMTSDPVQVGYADASDATCLTVSGNIAYVARAGEGISIIDITSPANPFELDYFEHSVPLNVGSILLNESYLYIAGYSDFRIYSVINPIEIGSYAAASLSMDVAINGNYAYIANYDKGLIVLDISDPSAPAEAGNLDTPGTSYGIAVNNNYACIADGTGGMRVINISNPAEPAEEGFFNTLATGELILKGDTTYVPGNSSLHIVDISIPSSPNAIGFYDTGEPVNLVTLDNQRAYVAESFGPKLFIIDTSNPTNPNEVGQYTVQDRIIGLDVSQNYAYLGNRSYGLRIIDVSDTTNLFETGYYDTPGLAGDVEVNGDYACVADWNSGVRIINISDPINPVEEGYFDTGHLASRITLDGPYIYVADNNDGIYILQEKLAPLAPIDLTAGGSSPSPYQNSPSFELNWMNPGDLSGIGQAKYKIGSPPTSNDKCDSILTGDPPLEANVTVEGNQILYLWLVDNAGNEDFNNYDTVTVRYDHSVIPPSDFAESNGASDNTWQNTINIPTFIWDRPADISGIIKFYIYFGPDANESIRTDSTSNTYYTITAPEGVSYFRVQARDRVNNLSDWTAGFTFKYDVTKPEDTRASSPDTSGGIFEVSWSGGSDGNGSGLNGNYDIRFRDGNGSWIDWLTDFNGEHAEFGDGEVGHTYYFEAAARDSAGNVEDFSGQPEDTTFIGSYLGFIISKIDGEQSDSIEFNFTISNSQNTATDIKCEYSLESDSLWNLATVIGITTTILPENYQGSITWNSYADEPGVDLETVRFKITPSDINGAGIFDYTPPFHLDNNRIPSILIDSLEDEQNENITISYHLSDLEQDTLTIICEYFHPNNKSWQSATITGNLLGIVNADYDGSIIWNSTADFPEGLGYYLFRIKPYDNDLGIIDTDSIYVDNVGAPDVRSMSNLIGEQSGEIQIDYVLYDEQGEPINLDCQYSANSGEDWFSASVSGNLTNISPENYSGSLIWKSAVDLPGVDKTSVRFSIKPYNNYQGRSRETTDFHIDNNMPPSLQIGTIISPQGGIIKIPITVNDIEEDTIHISGMYSLAGSSWKRMQFEDVAPVTTDDYAGTIYWNSHTDLPFNEFKQVQIQLCPMDNDSGMYSLSTLFDIHNYPGDYTGDIQIDSEDLVPFALAWHQQDLEKEIGPATGSPPLLKPEPDNKIDFEDLMVLVQQWNWSYDNPVDALKKPLSSGNKIKSEVPLISKEKVNQKTEYIWNTELKLPLEGQTLSPKKPHLIHVTQSNYDQWANEFADQLIFSIDTLSSILSIQIEMNYQPDIFSFKDIDNILLREQNGFTFKADDEKNGRIIFSTIVLEANKHPLEIRDDLFHFNIEVRKDSHFPLDYRWKIYSEEGHLITQGQANFDLETHRSKPAEYSLYQNYPNPFNPSTTIHYQLPVDGKVRMDIFNILGERVETLINETQKPGYYSQVWDISKSPYSIASGIYFVRLVAAGNDGSHYMNHKKLLFLK
jgi:hypothetical protein